MLTNFDHLSPWVDDYGHTSAYLPVKFFSKRSFLVICTKSEVPNVSFLNVQEKYKKETPFQKKNKQTHSIINSSDGFLPWILFDDKQNVHLIYMLFKTDF